MGIKTIDELQDDLKAWVRNNLANKALVVTGKPNTGKFHAISDIDFASIGLKPLFFENPHSTDEFYGQLMNLYNPVNGEIAFDSFTSVGEIYGFSIIRTIQSIIYVFKNAVNTNFKILEDKICSIFSKRKNNNKYVLILNIDDSASDRFVEFIMRTLSSCAYIVLIVDADDLANIKLKKRKLFDYYKIYEYRVTKENIYKSFPDVQKEKIDTLTLLADNISDIINAIECGSSKEIIEANVELMHKENIDAYEFATLASYFEGKFTKQELNYIYNKLNDKIIVCKQLNSILEYLTTKNIMEQKAGTIDFIVTLFKVILKENSKPDKEFFLRAAEEYFRKYYPTEYKKRYDCLIEASAPEEADIPAFFYNISLGDSDDITKLDFYGDETKNFFKCYMQAVKDYNNGNYRSVVKNLKICTANEALLAEGRYLTALCIWKSNFYERNLAEIILGDILSSPKAEWQTKFKTKMSLISIYINNSESNIDKKTVIKDYDEMLSTLENKGGHYSELLLNILYRKSAAVHDSLKAIKNVKKAYEYFKNYKEFYFEEYLYALCNYCALLLNVAGENTETAFSLLQNVITNEEISDGIKIYLMNNYLLACIFSNNIDKFDMEAFDKLIISASNDSRIMSLLNQGSYYLNNGELERGIACLKIASAENFDLDDYYVYYIESNLCAAYILKGELENAETAYNNSIKTKRILSAYDVQFINRRNIILYTLIESGKRYNLNDLKEIFKAQFDGFYLPNQLTCSVFIYSDMQFWTEN